MISNKRLEAPDSGVTVRMYRPNGLGDCFLLAFRARDASPRYMLVDCGVFFNTSGARARMSQIAADIEEATGGRLDVLVATHEHYDHLSGFHFATDVFDRMNIGEVWLAWTEDPANALARRLREKKDQALKALRIAITRMNADLTGGARNMEAEIVREVLDFNVETGDELDGTAMLGLGGTASQMKYVREKTPAPKFCHPGEPPITVKDVSGIKIYVLGPPEDEDLLNRSNPSKSNSEVYEHLRLNEKTAFYAVLGEDSALVEQSAAFDETSERIDLPSAAEHKTYGDFFRKHYSGKDEQGRDQAWRRIDNDWLRAAGPLALQLDSDTNNTSLAFAIELTESGRVLLFPGDAQVGNCLSWHEVSFNEGNRTITGTDLIRRTIFYKVGHHGSHNATLRKQGLELMESPELVAMIPVDRTQADKKKWAMPFEPLYERLTEKTRGRIIRADEGLPAQKPPLLSKPEWESFKSRTAQTDLWVQYTVPA